MSKYIDAERLKQFLKPREWGTPDERWVPEHEIGAMLDYFPAADVAPRWIPVTEQLPEKYGQYLVTFIPSGGTLWTKVLIARYSDLMGIAKPSFHIGEVGKNSFTNISEQVIAWMPLPEPYKGGEKE